MRVLAVSNIPFPYIVENFNELGKHCDLTVLFSRRHSKDRDKSWISDDVRNFKAIYLKGIEFGSENVLSFSIIKHLNQVKYDIIYFDCYSRATSILGILYLKLKKRPFIISADGGFINEQENIYVKKAKRFLIGSASYWLSSGKKTSEYLIHYGAENTKIFHYPFTSIAESEILKTPLTRTEKNAKKLKIYPQQLNCNDRFMILSVGQFIPRKGFETLIKAAKNLPNNYDIFIVGGRPTKAYLDLIEDLKIINVYFVDFKSKNELKDYYLAADIFVFPTNQDIWGLVINEAMAAGLPVITTDKCIAGLEMVKNGENGYIVPIGNEKALSDKIIELGNDASLRKEMTHQSLEKIKDYTIEEMAIEIINTFRSIMPLNSLR